MGFHLDDFAHRYMLSDLPGAHDLLRAYESPFGIANGDPVSNRWQVEHGYAPWWIERDLLVSLWRPLSELTHRLDAALWPANAVAMHAHSLLWFAALVFVTTRMYRQLITPPVVAGIAAIFYAFNHTHGFAVGWIANRNAIVTGLFGVLALWLYARARAGARWALLGSLSSFVAALLSGESSVAVLGYMVAHACFLDRAPIRSRVLALAPHLLTVVCWRVVYAMLDRGAHGSGLYIDPVREPFAFVIATLSRLPLLLMGQLALPPAEAYVLGPPHVAWLVLGFAWLLLVWFTVSAIPLARVDATARFWLAGMLMSFLPSCTTYASNRLLVFSGLGAMGLLAQLWVGFVSQAQWLPAFRPQRALTHVFVGAAAVLHLFVSPLLLPLSTRSVAFTRPINSALSTFASDRHLAQRELLVLSSPEYFFVKLIPPLRALNHQAPIAAIHSLSFGPLALAVTRVDAHTLDVTYAGGILTDLATQLYRSARSAMRVGERFDYRGVAIEILGVEADGRANRVRFTFERDLDDPTFKVVRWGEDSYVDMQLPKVGATISVPAAQLPLEIP